MPVRESDTIPGATPRPARALAAGPDGWRGPLLDHLPPRERRLFHRFGQGPEATVPDLRIHHAFERWAAATPDAVAAEHLGVTISYRELDRQANRLAARLADLGVRAGDAVGVFASRSLPMLVGILATLKAGAAYVPQDVRITPHRQLRQVATTARCRVVLTTAGALDAVPALPGVPRLAVDELTAQPLPPGRHLSAPGTDRPVTADDGCYVLFTSGTTGTPNGVTVTHGNVANLLLTAPGNLGIGPGRRVAQLLNVAFDMAAWEILGCLANGGTLLVRDRDLTATAARADVVIATPSVLGRIDPDRCAGVRTVAVAGEPCPRPLADRWAAGRAFYNCCGPTETTIVNTMHRHRPGGPLTIGRPTPNNTVYVLDADGRPCRIGEAGEMWAGGGCVSAGYLDNDALNAERYAPDPFLGDGRLMFRTRDRGRWTADGELEHLGRTDDQVKVRGFRVELDAVSAVLEAVPGCRAAVTLKLTDRDLVSFVAPAGLDPQRCRDAVAAALPYYCVPAAVHPLPELPMTGRGKVDRDALRRLALDLRWQWAHIEEAAA
ncbi:amino acid adenylation domain-containing protein [Micromonospora sp. WMMD712]|uniref:amino acid adenylation domain-containing protein n=1 Tax=Micromonospora sp. WMMD712 TaxID=3016096 RepID=UPI00249CBF06|nr:amino acid adenylation domain-containing protein [Micromonospora sp. WMMD712]WFE55351.1 amino acid adenylation domain-containing protein [Micromonospora sp. WMMD712]